LNVLKKIETLPWVVLYDTIQYQVDEYPQAKVTLILYLLSKKEKWLSVARDAVDNIDGRML
jgi:MSHA biogenesis protein MshJ